MLINDKTMGFILKGYPRVSETFIAQEIYLLEQKGFKIHILSLRKARETQRQPIVELIKAPISYIPEYILSADLPDILIKNFKTFCLYPKKYLHSFFKTAVKSLFRFDDSAFKRHLQAGWIITTILKNSEISHLHSHFAHTPTELAYTIGQITDLPFTISAHAKDIYTIPKSDLIERINASQMIMTCTKYNYEFLSALPQIHKYKINKVYHGINLEHFKKLATDKDSFQDQRNFLSVGRLVEKKGYEDIFAALRILMDQNIDFTYDIYGSGELKSALNNLSEKLGLSKKIIFHSTTTHPQIIERMKLGGIFICGSQIGKDGDRDGIPNTLAEAMAMELPVIATDVSGIPELVENNVTGLLINQNAPTEMATALLYLLNHTTHAKQMGKNARNKIELVFNCQQWIHQCAGLLQKHTHSEAKYET